MTIPTVPISRRAVLAGSLSAAFLSSPNNLRSAFAKDAPGWLGEIDTLLSDMPGVYGVAIVDPGGSVWYSRNLDSPFIAASLYKLVLVADVLAKIDSGVLAPDLQLYLAPGYFWDDPAYKDGAYTNDYADTWQPIEEIIWATICVSSNVGAQALLTLTSKDELNARADSFGMTNTLYFCTWDDLARYVDQTNRPSPIDDYDASIEIVNQEEESWNVNLTSPADMMTFFAQVFAGGIVNENVSLKLRELLLGQLITDRIPQGLPSGVPVAHKTGNLTGIVHDVGSVPTPDGPVTIVTMTQGVPDEAIAVENIRQISRIVYNRLIQQHLSPPRPNRFWLTS